MPTEVGLIVSVLKIGAALTVTVDVARLADRILHGDQHRGIGGDAAGQKHDDAVGRGLRDGQDRGIAGDDQEWRGAASDRQSRDRRIRKSGEGGAAKQTPARAEAAAG